jgi:bacteriorhodopsin
VTDKRVYLGLRFRVYCSVAFSLVVAVVCTIAVSFEDGTFKFWHYCLSALSLLITLLMAVLWCVICHGTISAAKNLGDEIEQLKNSQ